jgi:hypothetical protein
MNERQERTTKPEFSTRVAIGRSMPLLVLVSAYAGPLLWDVAANAIGWSGGNVARMIREQLTAYLCPLVVVAIYFSPSMVTYCSKTSGHDALRRSLQAIHFLASLGLVGLLLGMLVWLLAPAFK